MKKYPRLNDIAIALEGFSNIFKYKSKRLLNTWIDNHKNCEIKKIQSFVNGVIKDYESVKNAVTYNYSNGVLEGNINRLKMIKRSMYGKAGFHLLRQKVLFHC
jgi:transposase